MPFSKSKKAIVVSLIIYLIFVLVQYVNPSGIEAASYYVDETTGLDSNPGTSGSPWKTLDYASRHSAGGDTVYCRGTFTEQLSNRQSSDPIIGGDATNGYWKLTQWPGEATCNLTASIDVGKMSNYIWIDGLTFSGYAGLRNNDLNAPWDETNLPNHWKVTNNTFTGPQRNIGTIRLYGYDIEITNNSIIHDLTGPDWNDSMSHGIYLHVSARVLIKNNIIKNAGGYGLHIFDQNKTGPMSQMVIDGNLIYHSVSRAGIRLGCQNSCLADDVVIMNNIIYDNAYAGIVVGGGVGANDVRILNNTVWGNDRNNDNHGQIYLDNDNGAFKNIQVKNNILSQGSAPIDRSITVNVPEETFVISNNLYDPSENTINCDDTDPLVGDPLFVSAGTDFHLRSTSPAIDAGLTSPEVTSDFDNNPRPMDGDKDGNAKPDIGSFEYSGTYVPPAPDTEAPSVPQGLIANVISATQINLSWNASTDNVGVTGYNIYRDGTKIGSTSSLNYSNSGLTQSTTYSYRVEAYDAAGNSALSAAVTAATPAAPDAQAPSTPSGLSATAVSATRIDLSWNASTDNVGVVGYKIFRDGTQIATTSSTSFSDNGLSPATSYSYRISAYDAANNESAQSSQATATTAGIPDTEAPTKPSELTATAVSSTRINLSWNVSTDNVGVAGYKIYRDGSLIKITIFRTYSDLNLTPSTTYTYTVKAYDAASNESPASHSASATTDNLQVDSVAPSAPLSLKLILN